MQKTLMLWIVVAFLAFHGTAREGSAASPIYPKIKGGNVAIEYHRFTLIKHDDHIIALHVLPDPRHGWDGITYRWYHLDNGSDVFFRPTPREADSAPNSHVKSGAGETDEGEVGSGVITAGPLKIKWSKGSHNSGWLYLSDAADVVQVYPKQFDRLDEFSGSLDPKLWKRAH